MNRDALIIAFAKLRAAGCNAHAELMTAAARLPRRQGAAFVREVEAVAALFEQVRPKPKPLELRPEPQERKGPLTTSERLARQRYMKTHASRLTSHLRVL